MRTGDAEGSFLATLEGASSGPAEGRVSLPYSEDELKIQLLTLENSLLGGHGRRLSPPQDESVKEFGTALFEALFSGDRLACYEALREEADREGEGLRLRLAIDAPEMALLPWEFLYDPRRREFLCLSRSTPMVRYLTAPEPAPTLKIEPPLRILGMIAGPSDLPALDTEAEVRRVEEALAGLVSAGVVQITWLAGGSWKELQRESRREPWHVFHFVGHGVFDATRDEGCLAFVGETGETDLLTATEVGMFLGDDQSLRLAVLNACEGARGSERDLWSSTASILVHSGVPAVVAMQYEISDRGGVEFARAFYEAITDGLPIDVGVAEARKTIRVAERGGLEWGVPVLYMCSEDGVLFDLKPTALHARVPTPSPSGEPETEPEPEQRPSRKRGLLIALGAAAVVIAALLLFAFLGHRGTQEDRFGTLLLSDPLTSPGPAQLGTQPAPCATAFENGFTYEALVGANGDPATFCVDVARAAEVSRLTTSRTEVTARFGALPDNGKGGFGLTCRSSGFAGSGSHYLADITTDGFATIDREAEGDADFQNLNSTSDGPHIALDQDTTLRLDCWQTSDGENLDFWVNGTLLVSAVDTDPLPALGTGLLVWGIAPGRTEAVFRDLSVYGSSD